MKLTSEDGTKTVELADSVAMMAYREIRHRKIREYVDGLTEDFCRNGCPFDLDTKDVSDEDRESLAALLEKCETPEEFGQTAENWKKGLAERRVDKALGWLGARG